MQHAIRRLLLLVAAAVFAGAQVACACVVQLPSGPDPSSHQMRATVASGVLHTPPCHDPAPPEPTEEEACTYCNSTALSAESVSPIVSVLLGDPPSNFPARAGVEPLAVSREFTGLQTPWPQPTILRPVQMGARLLI